MPRIYKLETTILQADKISRPGRKMLEISKHEGKVKLNDTEKTILKLLVDGPKTSREIREQLNLSREHIARELKYLYEIGYVKRSTVTKPFKYEVNEEYLDEIKEL
jgi:predicted transcriptional regulator